MTDTADLLTAEAVAALRGVHVRTVYRAIQRGDLPATDAVVGRRVEYRIARAEAEAWVIKGPGGYPARDRNTD